MTTPVLEVHNLAHVAQAKRLFTGLSFILMPNEILQVMGSNGSGKSSLLKLLSGLLPVEHGKVIHGTEGLLYVGHKLGIKLGLTVMENLRELAALYGVFDPSALMLALEQFELQAVANLVCAHLSAGQRQRVALARMRILNVKLWVLDEPFAHLDNSSCDIVVHCMRQHCAGGGVVMATHQALSLDIAQQTLSLS